MSELERIRIEGYRPFRRLDIGVESLQVFVGSNGSGKSSLFEFLQLLRDGMDRDIPPAIAPGSAGKTVFHAGMEQPLLRWRLGFEHTEKNHRGRLEYGGELLGPIGQVLLTEEFVRELHRRRQVDELRESAKFLEIKNGEGEMRSPSPADPDGNDVDWNLQRVRLKSSRRLALGTIHDLDGFPEIGHLGSRIARWSFIDGLAFDLAAMRQPVTIEQDARLREDGSNLSVILFQLQSEHPEIFERINRRMRSFVDSFGTLNVKAQGAPGQVLAFVNEPGSNHQLGLGDLSDGILRLLTLTVLCYQPDPPPLVCIDEPVQGVHPKTVPILAGMFQKLATRTQVFLITHSPYFLSQFALDEIIVFRRRDGQTVAHRPADSGALIANLDEFGTEELRQLHRTDELSMLSPTVDTDNSPGPSDDDDCQEKP